MTNSSHNLNYVTVVEEERAPEALLFVFSVCMIAGLLRSMKGELKTMSPPLPLILFFLGVAYGFVYHLGNVPKQFQFLPIIEAGPFMLKAVWMPILLFDFVFAVDTRTFTSLFFQVIVIGLLNSMLILLLRTFFVWLVFMQFYNWELWICIMYACLSSVVDSTVILKLFKEVGSFKTFCRLLEGEVFIAICVVFLFVEFFENFYLQGVDLQSAWNFVSSRELFVCVQLFLSPTFGYVLGHLTVSWLMKILNDPIIEVVLAVSIGYVTFLTSSILDMSPTLSFMVYVLVLSHRRVCFFQGNDVFLLRFFDILKFFGNANVYVMAGIHITRQTSRLALINWSDVCLTLVIYFTGIFTRGILAVMLYPILYIGGYHMTVSEGAVFVWCGINSSWSLLLGMVVCNSVLVTELKNNQDPFSYFKFYFQICGMFVLTSFFNGGTTVMAMDFFGMRHIPKAKRFTMSNAIQILRDVIHTSFRAYRADRFLADADWEIVYKHVYLDIPYKTGLTAEGDLEEMIEEVKPLVRNNPVEGRLEGERPDKEIIVVNSQDTPGSQDSRDLFREARVKVFRSKKASFWKQYQHGMLSLDAVRVLVESIDYAQDDEDHVKQIEKVMKMCQVKGIFRRSWLIKRKFEVIDNTAKKLLLLVIEETKNKKFRRFFLSLHRNRLMRWLLNIILWTNLIVIIIALVVMWNCTRDRSLNVYKTGLDVINAVVVAVFTFVVLCKMIGFGKHYFKTLFNHVDFIILIIAYVDIILKETAFSTKSVTAHDQLYCREKQTPTVMNEGYRKLLIIETVFLSSRLLRSFRLLEINVKYLIKFFNELLQARLKLGYDIGKGYVTCVEEVYEALDTLIQEKEVLERYRDQLFALRLMRMKELATLQKMYPGIVLSVKSQHAGRRILNNLGERVVQLRKEGMLDERESDTLERMIASRLKLLLKIPPDIPLPAPTKVLSEISWVARDKDFIEYIQNNSKLVGMAEGEMLDSDSNPYGGLYIVISGLVRVDMYLHDTVLAQKAKAAGTASVSPSVPVVKEQEKCSDYLTTGSTLGEMSLLTGNTFKTIATCETAVQLCHFDYEAVQAALELYVKHPSLEHQLWYACSLHVAYALLKKRQPYRNMAIEELKMIIENGILFVTPWDVPDGGKFEEDSVRIDLRQLSNYEIIIVYGSASSADGFETFRGPCVVPVGIEFILFEPHDTDKYVIYVIPHENPTLMGSRLSPPDGTGSAEREDHNRQFVESFFKKANGPQTLSPKPVKEQQAHNFGGNVTPRVSLDTGITASTDYLRRSTTTTPVFRPSIAGERHQSVDRRMSTVTTPTTAAERRMSMASGMIPVADRRMSVTAHQAGSGTTGAFGSIGGPMGPMTSSFARRYSMAASMGIGMDREISEASTSSASPGPVLPILAIGAGGVPAATGQQPQPPQQPSPSPSPPSPPQRKMSSPTQKMPESLALKKRLTDAMDKRDSF